MVRSCQSLQEEEYKGPTARTGKTAKTSRAGRNGTHRTMPKLYPFWFKQLHVSDPNSEDTSTPVVAEHTATTAARAATQRTSRFTAIMPMFWGSLCICSAGLSRCGGTAIWSGATGQPELRENLSAQPVCVSFLLLSFFFQPTPQHRRVALRAKSKKIRMAVSLSCQCHVMSHRSTEIYDITCTISYLIIGIRAEMRFVGLINPSCCGCPSSDFM